MKYDVFISHSGEDHELAMLLCQYLEQDGKIKCWIAPRDVTGGLPYARCIFNAIDESQVVLFVFSEHSNLSRHIESEIDAAFNKDKIIIPFRIDGAKMSSVLNYYLGASHCIDGQPEPRHAFDGVKESIINNLPELSMVNRESDALQLLADRYHVSIEKIRDFFDKQTVSTTQAQDEDDSAFNQMMDNFLQRRPTSGPIPNTIGARDRYSIMQNNKGELMLMMDSREGNPDNPRFIYDGSAIAILYRSSSSSVAFRNINEPARQPLYAAREILVVEIGNNDVVREYMTPMRHVKSVENLIISNDEPQAPAGTLSGHDEADDSRDFTLFDTVDDDLTMALRSLMGNELSKAKQHFLALAETQPVADFAVGLLLMLEIPQKPEEAFTHFLSAAKHSLPMAQYVVARAYWHGIGTERSLQKAYMWMSMAYEQNPAYEAGLNMLKEYIKQ